MDIVRPTIGRRAALLVFLMGLAVTPPAPAFYGTVRTTEGKLVEGDIHLEEDAFHVTDSDGQSHVIALSELQSYASSDPPPAIATPGEETNQVAAVVHSGLLGTYFSESTHLTGAARTRVDETVDFNWETGSPFDDFPADQFSVRWEGELLAPATGFHKFHVVSDDGVRLWVNDALIVDQWRNQSAVESIGQIALVEGQHYAVKLEYFENTGQAVARLLWTVPDGEKETIPAHRLFVREPPKGVEAPATEPIHGWLAMYYKNKNLTGAYIAATNETIDFNWRGRAPLQGLPRDQFSVRWVGRLSVPEEDQYFFHVENDDGVRLWIDDNLILDHWRDGILNLTSAAITLEKDRVYTVRYEMFENTSEAQARLFWSTPRMPRTIVPKTRVQPASPPPRDEESTSALSRPPGVWLTDGSFLAKPVQTVDDGFIRFSRAAADPALAAANAARIQLHEEPANETKEPGPEPNLDRPGLLLKSGDFMDGELRKMENNRVEINSVLLGLKTFRFNQVEAVIYRAVKPRPARFEIRTKDQSLYRVDQLQLREDRLVFLDAPLRGFSEPGAALTEMRRLD